MYSEFDDILRGGAESGGGPSGMAPSRDDALLVYATMHGSYTSLNKVGESLEKSDEEDLQTIGKKMVDCAHTAMPAMFSKEE